jgi:putative two-component system response regulator
METAIEHIEAHTGIMFDPAIVTELKKLFIDGTLASIMVAYYE